ncbi:MAG: hypothetical protein WAM05_19985 [Candidatus Binataceae bacterium]
MNNSPRTYSSSHLVGKWKITLTLASYAKFGGGPQLGSGEIEFDRHGGIRGQQIYLGELDSVNGRYVMDSDGKGTAVIFTVPKEGGTARTEYSFQIVSDKEIDFVAEGLPLSHGSIRDWISTNAVQQAGHQGITGKLLRE